MANIFDYAPFTVEAIRQRSDEDLYTMLNLGGDATVNKWISDELQRRHLIRIGEAIDNLTMATSSVRLGVDLLTASSTHIGKSTDGLIRETKTVGKEVGSLTTSSRKLENLTVRLNRLTVILIILTVVAIVAPILVEVWKVYHESSGSIQHGQQQPPDIQL